ncbi:hypothetical protein [Dyadobacter diqingensis]|jgi:hypothetical protein|uniref:hypothetical protein n=1 Tax=Dyadobacter diqingensis TaxID=2938121 RepID=UPI0020C1CF07|nr:hypothetical protein [Dyadobacter diqingensis]
MGKGKDLFGKYNDLAKEKGVGSEEYSYACVLFQALLMLGERRVFELLEEADVTGKKLALEYAVHAGGDDGDAVPSDVILV